MTLSRTYKWQTESREDQQGFIEALVRLFRTVAGPQAPLQLDGVQDLDIPGGMLPPVLLSNSMPNILEVNGQNAQRPPRRPGRSSPVPGRPNPLRTQPSRIAQNNSETSQRVPSPVPTVPVRNGAASRSGSPNGSTRERVPPPISVPHPSAPIPIRRPSNQTNGSSTRTVSNSLDPSRLVIPYDTSPFTK